MAQLYRPEKEENNLELSFLSHKYYEKFCNL